MKDGHMTISLRGVSVLLFIATAARGPRTAAAAGDPLFQPPDPSSRAGPRNADRGRRSDRRHRPVPGGPRDRRPHLTRPSKRSKAKMTSLREFSHTLVAYVIGVRIESSDVSARQSGRRFPLASGRDRQNQEARLNLAPRSSDRGGI